MKKLSLATLEDGHSTGLSVRNGGFLAEAASVCLTHHAHPMKLTFPVYGTIKESYEMTRLLADGVVMASYEDLSEAAEFGAMGIAVVIIHDQKGWKVKRSWKGTGFDYWVGEQTAGYPFQNLARMEVSGDFKGTDTELQHRLNVKLDQTARSAGTSLPAYAVIVEFSNPKTLTGIR